MAINPNTDFVAGAILTAAQQNRFPRGIVALKSETTNFTNGTTEAVSITATSFTAVANRYYKITYFEPAATVTGGAGNYVISRIKLTNALGTQYGQSQLQASGATSAASFLECEVVTTLTAGTTVIVGTLFSNSGSPVCYRSTGNAAQIVVEDIGPA